MCKIVISLIIATWSSFLFAQSAERLLEQKGVDYFIQNTDKVNGVDLSICRLYYSGQVEEPEQCFSFMQLECLIGETKNLFELWNKEEQMYEQIVVDANSQKLERVVLDYSIVYQEEPNIDSRCITDYHLRLSKVFRINGTAYVCIVMIPYSQEASVNYYFVEFNPSGDPVEIYTTSLDICYVE